MATLTAAHARKAAFFLLDQAVICGALYLAFLLRFDFTLSRPLWAQLVSSLPALSGGYLLPFLYFRLYSGMWRYSSFADLVRIMEATAAGSALSSTLILFLHHGDYPRSVLLMTPLITFLGVAGLRFLTRFGKDYLSGSGNRYQRVSTLIVGAGDMGEDLLRQMRHAHELTHEVIGFIDDSPAKQGLSIHDVPVLGGIADLPRLLSEHAVDEIIIAINTRRGDIVRSVADAMRQAKSKAEIKVAPRLEEFLQTQGSHLAVRKVKPADLLNRDVIHLDEPKIARFLAGRSVLVTGAGGTIGAELCRQALYYGPSRLILLDSHATSLFYCERELRSKTRDTALIPILGSTLDQGLVERVFADHKPNAILHAAAHKHLPQLEINVQEAVQNNFLATYALARAAHEHRSEYFLLVSTDKAVRPSSVMGATKRAAELAVQAFAKRSKTRFLAVRFGNVLGSSGSVLKIFQEQIEQGGPVTLTHPDMRRYFMTVEEAVQLILQSCAMAKGGEIFILKMGEPVRILDMAKNLILLNGLEPDKDIGIKYTGIRPGEKLSEDLAEDADGSIDSPHPRIMQLKNDRAAAEVVDKAFGDLSELCKQADARQVLERLRRLVPSFTPSGH